MSNILEINDITFGYSKQKLLFKDFSLSLKKGEVKAIVGSSGIGKSTLFELILNNIKPFRGTISSAKSSQVFQDPYSSFHPSYNILNQMRDVAKLENLQTVLKEINLDYSFLLKLPHELSGGQLQRASIVRAILMEPELLLLDEPTSALDNVTKVDVMKNLMKDVHSRGILLITHDMELARWCADEIITLK